MTSTESLPIPFPSTVSATDGDNAPIDSHVTATPMSLEPSPKNPKGLQETSKPAKRPTTKEKENATSTTRLKATQTKTTGTVSKPTTAKPVAAKPAPTAPRTVKTSTLANKPSPNVSRKSTPALSTAKPVTAQPVVSRTASRPLTPSKAGSTQTTESRSNATKTTSVKTTAVNPPVSRTKLTSARSQSATVEPKPSPSKPLPKRPVLANSSTKSANVVSNSADKKAVVAPPKNQLAELKLKVETSAKELSEKDNLLAQKEAELNDLRAQILATKTDATMVEKLQVQNADYPIEEAMPPANNEKVEGIDEAQALVAVDTAMLESKENAISELTRQLSTLQNKHAEEMNDVNATFKEALSHKEEEHANAVRTLQEQLAQKAEIAQIDINNVDRERETEKQKQETTIISMEKELAQMAVTHTVEIEAARKAADEALAALAAEHATEKDQVSKDISDLKVQIAELLNSTVEVTALRDEIVKQKEEHARYTEELELKLAKKEIDETAAVAIPTAVDTDADELATLREAKLKLEMTVDSLNTEMADLMQKHDREIKKLEEEHEFSLERASKEIAEESETASSRRQEEIRSTQREYYEQREAATEKERAIERAEMDLFKSTSEQAAREDTQKITEMKAEIELLTNQLRSLEAAYNEQNSQLERFANVGDEDMSNAKTEIDLLKKEVARLESVQTEMEKQKVAALDTLVQQHQQEVSLEAEKYAAAQDESKNLIEQLRGETDMLKLALEDQKRKYEDERQDLIAQVSPLPNTNTAFTLQRKVSEDSAAREETASGEVNAPFGKGEDQEAKDNALLDAQSALRAHETKIEQLEEELRLARAASAHASPKQDVVGLGEDVNVHDLADLEAKHKKEMNDLCQSVKEKLKQKDEDIASLLKQVEYVTKAHDEDVRSIRNRCTQEVEAMKEMLRAKEKDYNDSMNTLREENAHNTKMMHQLQQDVYNKNKVDESV